MNKTILTRFKHSTRIIFSYFLFRLCGQNQDHYYVFKKEEKKNQREKFTKNWEKARIASEQ